MNREHFGSSQEKALQPTSNVSLAKLLNTRFRLIKKLGITSESERDLSLLHVQLRILRHRYYGADKLLKNPFFAIHPNLRYSALLERKADLRTNLGDRIAQITSEIDERQQMIYEATPGTLRPRTIELAINMFMSGGDSYFARNMGTTFFRKRASVKNWQKYWRNELNSS